MRGPPTRPETFPSAHRLRGRQAFDAVFSQGGRQQAGPLLIRLRKNDLDYLRLGLSVGRRIGNAVTRHRVKRYLREAYRLQRHDLPVGYDVMVSVRPHPPANLKDYQDWLQQGISGAADASDRKHRRSQQREG